MPQLRTLALALCATGTLVAADLPRERHTVDQRQLPVTNRTELTFKARADADVKTRELWYASFDGRAWGTWQKHGITFDAATPITWQPPEGHWKVFVRIEEISGLADPAPTASTPPAVEFIVDRTPPAVAIDFPTQGFELRGGSSDYEVRWTVTDPHLHSTPIAVQWARDAESEFSTVTEALANSGSLAWTTPRDMTASGRLRLLATDKAGNTGSAEVGGLVVDAVVPRAGVLGPQISASRQVPVQVAARDAGPAGLAWIRLYWSADGGVTWNKGPEATGSAFEQIPFTATKDGRIALALVAADEAGNVAPVPTDHTHVQHNLLVDTTAPAPVLASPIGIRLVDADPDAPLQTVYKPGDQVVVASQSGEANPAPGGATISLQVAADAPWQPLGENLEAGAPFTFTIPDVDSTAVRIKLEIVDTAGNRGQAIATDTFRIDNTVEGGAVTVEFD